MQGSVALASDGSGVVYTIGDAFQSLRAGTTTSETFTYTMADAAGAQSTATVTMVIAGTNDAPVAVNDNVSTHEDQSLMIQIVANDTDVDTGDTMQLVSIDRTGTTGSTAFASAGGVPMVYYNPSQALKAGETATDSFKYTIRDSAGALATATVTIQVTGANDAPVAMGDSATVSANSGQITIDVLANDTDLDAGDTKAVTWIDGSGRPATFVLVMIYGVGAPLAVPAIPAIKGSIEIAPGGQGILYSPGHALDYLAAGQSVVETIFYSMQDSAGAASGSQLLITVTGVNDGPTAANDTALIAKNSGPVTLNVLANDIDPDAGDTKSVLSLDTTGTQGTVTIAPGGGNVVYTVGTAFQYLAEGETATDTFSYTMKDTAGVTSTAQVTVTISGTNNAPTAVADTASATENGAAISINVLANDTDADIGDTRKVLSVDNTGTVGLASVASGGGSVTYTIGSAFQSLAAGVQATDTFTYTMADSGGAQSTASVTVTVTGINDAPIAVANTATVQEDGGPVTLNVLANDIDVDAGDTLSLFSLTTTGLKGTAVMDGSNIVYTPYQTLRAGQTATDTFSYKVVDSAGAQSATATVTMTVVGANDAPVANPNVATVTEDVPTTILVLANDTDVDVGDTKRVVSVDNTGLKGVVSIATNGTGIVYTSGSAFQHLLTGQTATETFNYTMADSAGATSTSSVTVTINGVTDGVTARNDTAATHEDSGPIVINVLANDYNGDLNPTGQMTITSINGAGQLGGLTIIGTYGVGVGSIFAGFPRLLGDAIISPDGHSIIYTPLQNLNAGETGVDQFLYTITGSNGGSSTAVVTVTVTGANDAPVAVNDSANIAVDSAPITIDVLANDTDLDTIVNSPLQQAPFEFPDGGMVWDPTPRDIPDTKIVVAVNDSGLQGSVAIAAGGTGIVYTVGGTLLNLGYGQSAVETFTYTMQDGAGAQSTATVTVHVNGVNHAPVAVADTAAAIENGAPVTINVLANDTDPDTAAGDTLSVIAVNSAGLQGTAAINGGNVVYTIGNAFQSLRAGVTATETFSYTIADSAGAQSSANVVVTVTGVNDAPTAVANAYSISEDSGPVALTVLANDTDVDAGDTKTVTAVNTAGLQGTAVVSGDGASVIYTVSSAFQSLMSGQTATESFTYTMRDSTGALSTAAVTITIIGADEPVIYINPPTTGTGPYPGTSGDDVMSGTGGADTMYGQAGDDEIAAGEGADSIFGGADDDTISGDGGNDTINGGMGRDDLTGGAGADTFRFYLASESTLIDFDRIRDFKAAEGDKIDLSLIDANTLLGDNNAFTLAGSFTGVAGQLIYGTTASGYLVQGDVNGDAVADIAIEVRLVGSSSLSGADFIL